MVHVIPIPTWNLTSQRPTTNDQRPMAPVCRSSVVGGRDDGFEIRNGISPIVNRAGMPYPSVIDPRTGQPIPFPSGNFTRVPLANRIPWGNIERAMFIAEWHQRGFSSPQGGWSKYDIHHIRPREFGGTNDFWNLVPVERTLHQTEFNRFWRDYWMSPKRRLREKLSTEQLIDKIQATPGLDILGPHPLMHLCCKWMGARIGMLLEHPWRSLLKNSWTPLVKSFGSEAYQVMTGGELQEE